MASKESSSALTPQPQPPVDVDALRSSPPSSSTDHPSPEPATPQDDLDDVPLDGEPEGGLGGAATSAATAVHEREAPPHSDSPLAPPSPRRLSPPSSASLRPSTTLSTAEPALSFPVPVHSFPPPPSASPLPSTTLLTTPSAAMSRTASSSSSAASFSTAPAGARVWGVCLVGFDHAIGPNVEWTYPKRLKEDDELVRCLPFLALPDGAHAREEDYSYFHLLLPSISSGTEQTIFGISCNRQIPADELLNKGKDVTRSTVQKAIVVLANKPIFGPLREKLGVITRSFFAQRDFDDKSILVDLYQSFEPAAAEAPPPPSGSAAEKGKQKEEEEAEDVLDEDEAEEGDGGMYMGTSLRELVYRFRFKTLMLLKLLMLQRRVMFFAASTPVEQLCNFQYSLVALIPALLTNLHDAASPSLDTRAQRTAKPSSLKTSDRRSLIRYLGLPLDIFGANSFFQPYLPLQQIELLKTRSFLVGTTNSIFQQQRDCKIDVIVNIDSATLDILNPSLTPLVTLTAADRKWMDELVTLVDSSWNASDPQRPLGQGFVGSDDFLRGKFEEYVCSLLACVKFGEYLQREGKGERAEMLLSAPELESYNPTSFNEGFIKAFKRTAACELWDRNTDEVIFDLVEPKHPMEGKTHLIEDVGIRLVHGLHDHLPAHLNLSQLPANLNLSQLPANLRDLGQLPANLNSLGKPARERLSRGWSAGGEWFAGVQGALKGGGATPGSEKDEPVSALSAAPSGAAREGDPAAPGAAGHAVGTSILAGVDVAKTGAAQLATGIGSFLGNARKTSFFQTRPPSGDSASPSAAPMASASPPLGSTAPSTSPAPSGSFLRPLNTAAAATVPSSPSPRERTTTASSVGSFFGGLRKTLVSGGEASSVASTSAPRTPPMMSSPGFLSAAGFGGWGSRPTSPSASPAKGKSPAAPTGPAADGAALDERAEGLRIRDLDEELLQPRNLDEEYAQREREAQEEQERQDERERAMRRLMGEDEEERGGGKAGA